MSLGPALPRRAMASEGAALALARSPEDLAANLASAALAQLASDVACVSLDGNRLAEVSSWGPFDPVSSDCYDRHWRARDPVAQAAHLAHEPTHDGAVFEQARWRAEPLFGAVFAPSGLHHYMVVPLLGGGRVVGTLALARSKERCAFRDADCVRAGSLAGHASAILAALREPAGKSGTWTGLTSTERVTAEMAAEGYTVDAIALTRDVSRNTVKDALRGVYRKLRVSSRVELARKLR